MIDDGSTRNYLDFAERFVGEAWNGDVHTLFENALKVGREAFKALQGGVPTARVTTGSAAAPAPQSKITSQNISPSAPAAAAAAAAAAPTYAMPAAASLTSYEDPPAGLDPNDPFTLHLRKMAGGSSFTPAHTAATKAPVAPAEQSKEQVELELLIKHFKDTNFFKSQTRSGEKEAVIEDAARVYLESYLKDNPMEAYLVAPTVNMQSNRVQNLIEAITCNFLQPKTQLKLKLNQMQNLSRTGDIKGTQVLMNSGLELIFNFLF